MDQHKRNGFASSAIAAASLAALTAASASAQVTVDIAAVSAAASTDGQDVVYVLPGDAVPYRIEGLLGGDPSQGIGMFTFDLSFTGGALAPVDTPTTGALAQFVAPLGFNNPAGFGGTVDGGTLLQVGGAMNTINNQFAPVPTGTVVTGLATGTASALATGTLTAPTVPGTYQLRPVDPMVNALNLLEPAGYWSVRGAEPTEPSVLTVTVLDCGSTNYCAGKVNSLGCTPFITAAGGASISGSSSLTLTANDVVNSQFGLFVWSLGSDATPLFGGTLCVAQPLFRVLPATLSGGVGAPGTSCDGEFVQVVDASFIQQAGLELGDTVHCQWIYRDPAHPDGTGAGLTDAIRVTVCP